MSESIQTQSANTNRSDADGIIGIAQMTSSSGTQDNAAQDLASPATPDASGDSVARTGETVGQSDGYSNHPQVRAHWQTYLRSCNGVTDVLWADRLPQMQLEACSKNTTKSGVYEAVPFYLVEPGLETDSDWLPDPATDRYPFASLPPKMKALPLNTVFVEDGLRRQSLCQTVTQEGSKYMMRKLAEFPEPLRVDPGYDTLPEGKEYVTDPYHVFLGSFVQLSLVAEADEQDKLAEGHHEDTIHSRTGHEDKIENGLTKSVEDERGFEVDTERFHYGAVVDRLMSFRISPRSYDRDLTLRMSGSGYFIEEGEPAVHGGVQPDVLKAICRTLKNQEPSPYIMKPSDLKFLLTKTAWEVSRLYTEFEKEDPATADEKLKRYIDEHRKFGNEPLYNLTYHNGVVSKRTKESMMEDLQDDDISKKTFVLECRCPAVPSISIRWTNTEDWKERKKQIENSEDMWKSRRKVGHNTKLNVGIPHQDFQTRRWRMTPTPGNIIFDN